MRQSIKTILAATLLTAGVLIVAVSVQGQGAVEGQPCDRQTAPYIYQCVSEDTFRLFKCQHPDWQECVRTYEAAEAQFDVCLDQNRAVEDSLDRACLFPIDNAHVDWDDAKVVKEFADYAAECKKSREESGWADPCCDYLSQAQECSQKIIVARKMNNDCRSRTDWIYKPDLGPMQCASCSPGKILDQNEACGAVPAPVDEKKSEAEKNQEQCKKKCSALTDYITQQYCNQRTEADRRQACVSAVDSLLRRCSFACDNVYNLEMRNDLSIREGRLPKELGYAMIEKPSATAYDSILDLKKRGQRMIEFQLANGVIIQIDALDILPEPPSLKDYLEQMRTNTGFLPGTDAFVVPGDIAEPNYDYGLGFQPVLIGDAQFITVNEEAADPGSWTISFPNKSETSNNSQSLDAIQPISGLRGKFVPLPAEIQAMENPIKFRIKDRDIVVAPNSRITIVGENSIFVNQGTASVTIPEPGSGITVQTPLGSVNSEHTQFWVSYNPELNYALVGIWEGTVAIQHAITGDTETLEPESDTRPGLAFLLPPSQTQAVVSEPETVRPTSSSSWIWIVLLLILLGGGGYWLYTKGVFKKFIFPKTT